MTIAIAAIISFILGSVISSLTTIYVFTRTEKYQQMRKSRKTDVQLKDILTKRYMQTYAVDQETADDEVEWMFENLDDINIRI